MGEVQVPAAPERSLQRQQMRIRTIAVSFAAAVTSARRQTHLGPAERDALIEVWRVWSLDVLARYRAEIDTIEHDRAIPGSTVAILTADLDAAIRSVREA